MQNIALILRYRGTKYHGWQSQKNAASIQDLVTAAITTVTGSRPHPRLEGCGRTDAGVHALSYVASFKSDTRIPLDRLPLALNCHLPDDISVAQAMPVGDDFHARFSCVGKEYIYRAYDGSARNPFYTDLAWHHPVKLNVEPMREAAAYLLGEHDFTCFRAAGSKVKGTVRTLYWCDVTKDDSLVEIRVCASGFLYNMARIISGTLIYMSEGRYQPADMMSIIEGKRRTGAGVTLPAHGLYLSRTFYSRGILAEEAAKFNEHYLGPEDAGGDEE